MDGLLKEQLGSVNVMGEFGPEDDEGWVDVDGEGPPELEDMSEEINAARRMRDAAMGGSSGHNAALYEAVINDTAKQPPRTEPAIEVGKRVKISGLVKAPQYNGKEGKVRKILEDEGRVVVVLDGAGDKELKVKRENVSLAVGVKAGFFGKSGKSGKKGEEEPELVRPTGKKEGVLEGLKSLDINKPGVPEWMKPNEDLLRKVQDDKELASAVDNARINKAIEEVSKDPTAWHKYKDDPEVSSYFMKMMGLFGKQFEEHEKKNGGEQNEEEQITEIQTTAAKRSAMIQEISSSKAAEDKRNQMASSAKTKSAAPVRKGTTDYSKWDAIDSDDEEEAPKLPGVELPKVKRDDPRIKKALQDPKVQGVLTTLRTSADETKIQKAMEDEDVRTKVQLLIAAGVVSLRAPGT